jgi:LysR family glycine cleavage system transcriptional activator
MGLFRIVRHLPSLRALRAFEAAARHLSIVRAAEELRVTPAAISQQIKGLETDLGHPLFRRSGGLTLTAVASAALPQLSEAFDALEQAAQRLKGCKAGGQLMVSTPPSFAARWLIPRLDDFHNAHPDIDLRLLATTKLVDFAVDDVDIAIRYGSGRYPGLHTDKLKTEEIIPVAAPRLAERLGDPSDLLGMVLLHNESMDWDPTFPSWITWLRGAGIDPGDHLRLRRYSDANLVLGAAVAGLGVALTWRTLASEELAQGRLVAAFPGQPSVNAYHLVCPPRRLNDAPVAAFHRWMRERMREGADDDIQ